VPHTGPLPGTGVRAGAVLGIPRIAIGRAVGVGVGVGRLGVCVGGSGVCVGVASGVNRSRTTAVGVAVFVGEDVGSGKVGVAVLGSASTGMVGTGVGIVTNGRNTKMPRLVSARMVSTGAKRCLRRATRIGACLFCIASEYHGSAFGTSVTGTMAGLLQSRVRCTWEVRCTWLTMPGEQVHHTPTVPSRPRTCNAPCQETLQQP
jgi:hypothetical protein